MLHLPTYLTALALTLFVELLVASRTAGPDADARAPLLGRVLRDVFFVNLLVHPLSVLANVWLAPDDPVAALFGVELGVFAVEALLYWAVTRLDLARALYVSLVANVSSFVVYIGVITVFA
jgi:hypothetical protein